MTIPERHIAQCKCGQVRFEASGEPIVTTSCNCAHCQQAGRLLEALPGASQILGASGETPMTFYRKDHVHCTQGASLLGEHRLKPESPTRRIVASCCNTAMFLDFTKGHWISIYRERLPLERTVVDRKSGLFVLRLVWAWAQMGFRTPTITYVKGKINAIPS